MNAAECLPDRFNASSYFLDRHLEEGRGERAAVVHEERTLTYRDVLELANRTGNALRELDVEMEQRVLLACLDAPEFVGAFWGAIRIGAVPVPVSTLLRTADYRYLLDDSRARAAVVSAPLLPELEPALTAATGLQAVLVAGGAPGRHLSYEERLARSSAELSPAPTRRDDFAFWQYSSGSTGPPKG
ncbi:MAG: AMP-binding protein, partial [Candidatus Binatia bacterium]